MQTKNVSIEDLQNVVGEGNVHEAGEGDAVDGVEPSYVVEPGSVEEMSEFMKLARQEGLAVTPRGSGNQDKPGKPAAGSWTLSSVHNG